MTRLSNEDKIPIAYEVKLGRAAWYLLQDRVPTAAKKKGTDGAIVYDMYWQLKSENRKRFFLRRLVTRGDAALTQLFKHDRPLIKKHVLPFLRRPGADLDALIQEGSVGYTAAVYRWTPARGALTTTLKHWVVNAVQRSGEIMTGTGMKIPAGVDPEAEGPQRMVRLDAHVGSDPDSGTWQDVLIITADHDPTWEAAIANLEPEILRRADAASETDDQEFLISA